jgi:hypothetical protein
MGRWKVLLLLAALWGTWTCGPEERPTGLPPLVPDPPDLQTPELVVPSPGLVFVQMRPLPLHLQVLLRQGRLTLHSNLPILRWWDWSGSWSDYGMLVAVELPTWTDISLWFCNDWEGVCSRPAVVRVRAGEEPVPRFIVESPLPNIFPEGVPGVNYDFVRDYLGVLGFPQRCKVEVTFISNCNGYPLPTGVPRPPCGGFLRLVDHVCSPNTWRPTWEALHEFFHSVGLDHYCVPPNLMLGAPVLGGGECRFQNSDLTFFLTPSQLRWLSRAASAR